MIQFYKTPIIFEFLDTMISKDFETYKDSNVKETENSYEIMFSIPGYKKDEIKIQFEKGFLKVSSNLSEKTENSYYKKSFEKEIYISKDVDKNNIKAKLENGILIVNIQKLEKVKPIEINVD